MNVGQMSNKIINDFIDSGFSSPQFEAFCLIQKATGLSRQEFLRNKDRELSIAEKSKALDMLNQRLERRPLQYILGEWSFLNLNLSVGEGVLIPRPETEILCESVIAVMEDMPEEKFELIDLCSGSGSVALGIMSLLTDFSTTRIVAVEKSVTAMSYLRENCKKYSEYNVTPILADVLTDYDKFEPKYNGIISNPPYIKTEDLDSLSAEVKHEPVEALDAGDGYRFYKAIAKHWVPKIKKGGFCAVEIGIGQASKVLRLFEKAGLEKTKVIKDHSGIDRVVIGFVKKINY